ncbi:MAG: ABC transporter substrate-binding protein, partial [Proteobacteria bacterium]|nr:ABC transporter substrate-binding protein [Pseudomonadota bacterium]
MKKIAILTTAIIALMATAAWAAGPVKVGVVLPFSGPVGSDGTRTFNGIDLAVKQINAAGGIDFNGQKMPIEIVKEDSTCNPRMSVAAVEKLMTRDKVSVVIGDFCSTSTLAD